MEDVPAGFNLRPFYFNYTCCKVVPRTASSTEFFQLKILTRLLLKSTRKSCRAPRNPMESLTQESSPSLSSNYRLDILPEDRLFTDARPDDLIVV
jgi:hypothetical protein